MQYRNSTSQIIGKILWFKESSFLICLEIFGPYLNRQIFPIHSFCRKLDNHWCIHIQEKSKCEKSNLVSRLSPSPSPKKSHFGNNFGTFWAILTLWDFFLFNLLQKKKNEMIGHFYHFTLQLDNWMDEEINR